MSKPIVHVILPDLAKGSPEDAVATRALCSFISQMYAFGVVVHANDAAYVRARNPGFLHPAFLPDGTSDHLASAGVQHGYEEARRAALKV